MSIIKSFPTAPKQLKDFPFITIGTVVNNNDPQQMGRLKVVCPALGDVIESPVENLPWTSYAMPFGGTTFKSERGPETTSTSGAVNYGFWAIPKIGSQVLVFCVDGDIDIRCWFACVNKNFTPHTLPHGRFIFSDNKALSNLKINNNPVGPLASNEAPIQPLFDNLKTAFFTSSNNPDINLEYLTRGVDFSVSSNSDLILSKTTSNVPDDRSIEFNGSKVKQGYRKTNNPYNVSFDPADTSSLESTVYSITSPGFHTFAMDDHFQNCRMKFRTSAGHQIIMDDTNERIYINTAKGNNWIEIDQNGNIDIFSEKRVSIHAKQDINLTSDETVRITGKKGVHLYSDEDVRIQSAKDINMLSDKNINVQSTSKFSIISNDSIHVKSSSITCLESSGEMNVKGSIINMDGSSGANIKSGGSVLVTGSVIHLNGPSANSATSASPTSANKAFWTNRIPDREPWARVVTKDDFTHEPELTYDDENVGKVERGVTILRNRNWKR